MAETTRVRSTPQEGDGLFLHALIGAVVMFVLSIIPLSPVVGGAVSGYLHKREGAKVGALAGLFAAVPIVALVMFVVTFLVPVNVGTVGPLVGFGIAAVVLLLLVGLYTAGLGALGGYIGLYLYRSRSRSRSE